MEGYSVAWLDFFSDACFSISEASIHSQPEHLVDTSSFHDSLRLEQAIRPGC